MFERMEQLEGRRLLSAAVAEMDPPPPLDVSEQVYEPGSTVRGQTLGEWSAAWWQWAMQTPLGVSPLFDTTGAQAFRGDVGKVFFFAGIMGQTGDGLHAAATRAVTVPTGTPIFFPIINLEGDNPTFNPPGVEPPNYTADELREATATWLDPVIKLYASIDGQPVPDVFQYREAAPDFSYTMPDDYILEYFGYDFPAGTFVSPCVADGWYLMLKPMTPGTHVIKFGGAVDQGEEGEADDFNIDLTYNVTVIPKGKYNKIDWSAPEAPAATFSKVPVQQKQAAKKADKPDEPLGSKVAELLASA